MGHLLTLFAAGTMLSTPPATPNYYVNIANHVNLPQDLISATSTSYVRANCVHHRATQADYTEIQLAFVNGKWGVDIESNADYDLVVAQAGIVYNDVYYPASFPGGAPTLSKAFGSAKTDAIPGLSMPQDAEFFSLNLTYPADYASALKAITGYTNANPVVVSGAHSYLNGQKVQIKDLTTTTTGAITGATNANPVVITSVAHGLTTGKFIRPGANGDSTVGGMTQLNGNDYKIVVLTADTFSLQSTSGANINGTAFGVYTSGGTWRKLSELNFVANGNVAYTVANATGTTFELSGINGTGYGVFDPASVGVAERQYNHYGTTTGSTLSQDGVIFGKDVTLDLNTIARGAKILTPTGAQINGSGGIFALSVNPASTGVNYNGTPTFAGWYGIAGQDGLGAIHPGTGVGGFGTTSGGHVTSVTVTTQGTKHSAASPPDIYLGGTQNVGSGWGNSTGMFGPCAVLGKPNRAVKSLIVFADSYWAGGSNFPDGTSGAEEYLLMQQATVQRMAVNGASCGQWLTHNTNMLAIFDRFLNEWNTRYTHAGVLFVVNDLQYNNSLNSIETSLATGCSMMRARGIPDTIIRYAPPSDTSTDLFSTLTNQSTKVVGGTTAAYQPGGIAEQFNARILNGTSPIVFTHVLKTGLVLRDSVETTKWRADLFGGTITGSITGITNASPPVVTSPGHGIAAGRWVDLYNVGGMTEVNGTRFKVGAVTTNTFTLQTTTGGAVDSTGYGAYTSGGTWDRRGPSSDDGVHLNKTAQQYILDLGLDFTL